MESKQILADPNQVIIEFLTKKNLLNSLQIFKKEIENKVDIHPKNNLQDFFEQGESG